MPSIRAHRTALRLPQALALALILVLVSANAVGGSKGLTRTAATAHENSSSDAPSPTPSLALRPGARLAPERVLDFSSTPLALNYVITGQDAPPPGHGTAGPPASRTPDHHSAEQPGTASAHPSAGTSPASTATATATAAPSSASSSTQSSAPSDEGNTLPLYTLLGAAALATTALTAVLVLRRTRRHPKAGRDRSLETDTDTAASGDAAGETNRPDGVLLLDAALRTMAHHNAQLPKPAELPAVSGALIGTATVQVLHEDPTSAAPAPFTAGADGVWVLPDDADLLDADTAAQVPTPYPALVTLGTTSDGELLLLNLAALPALLLDGEPAHISEVCTALALELTTSPWSDGLELITVGCADGLDHLLPTPALTPLPDGQHAVREATERLLEAHQSTDAGQQPLVVLSADPLTASTAWHFADLTTTPATRPLTLIAPAHTTAPHFPDAPVLDTADNRAQYLEHLDTWVTLQRLTPTAYLQITHALSDAAACPPRTHRSGPDTLPGAVNDAEREPGQHQHNPGIPPASASSETRSPAAPATLEDGSGNGAVFPALLSAVRPTTTDPVSPAGATSGDAPPAHGVTHHMAGGSVAPPEANARSHREASAPQIRVLGPVEVDGVDAGGHGPRIAQLAALIYFKPGRTADALCTDMDPAHPWSATTLNARMHGLRAALGDDPTGRPYVPRRRSGDDPYHLAPTVTCDWTRFQHLTQHLLAHTSAGLIDVERLEQALALVRGTPFDGKPLPWAEPLQQEMTTAITQVAHTIATHRMSPGPHHDLDQARHAIARGIDIDETAEVLYRDWILVEHAAGNRHGVHTAISRAQHINHTLGSPLEEETQRLITQLLGHARHT
ncbi:hypothetical protein EJC51_46440 [Streptomyces aquilus]|uniref:Bacterial transcriptional activator domain-containing protein n=1 Tax=Streptomyces aquilus TaxID=2548456 RepID=A0A3Q9C7Q9_9ACTN|nr:bacterial transcriptional activator domain-containing protein [Streptomyces aquilus]AZP22830.1 hypothetical protein EJC51_46440 [Streptomyces aquilus]